jgi:hypothetical protein
MDRYDRDKHAHKNQVQKIQKLTKSRQKYNTIYAIFVLIVNFISLKQKYFWA